MDDSSKRCATCRVSKPRAAFAKNAARPDGLQARCRACVSEHYRKNADQVRAKVNNYRQANSEAVADRKRRYRANYPDRVKAQQRAAYEAKRDEYREKNRATYAARKTDYAVSQRAWVDANRERVRAYKSKYKHKRRALEASNGIFSVSERDLRRALLRADNACTYCRRNFSDDIRVTWDHVVPVTRGGTFSVGNLVPACGPCNSSKMDRTVAEWLAWKRRLNSPTILTA